MSSAKGSSEAESPSLAHYSTTTADGHPSRKTLLIGISVFIAVVLIGLGVSLGVNLSKKDIDDSNVNDDVPEGLLNEDDRVSSLAPSTYPPIYDCTSAPIDRSNWSAKWEELGQVLKQGDSGTTGRHLAMDVNGRVLASSVSIDYNQREHEGVRVYMYSTVTNEWTQSGNLVRTVGQNPVRVDACDLSGDGSILVLSETVVDDTGGSGSSSRVFVFEYAVRSNQWNWLGTDSDGVLFPKDENSGRKLHVGSVALSSDGMTLVTLLSNFDTQDNRDAQVRVHRYNRYTKVWVKLGQDLSGKFSTVSISGDGKVISLGSPYHDHANGDHSGIVLVYQYSSDTNEWHQLGQTLEGTHLFGHRTVLSVDGKTLACAAPAGMDRRNDCKAGYAQLYKYNFGWRRWTQIGPDLVMGATQEGAEWSMDMSLDGQVVGICSSSANVVRLHQYNISASKWEQIGQHLSGQGHAGRHGCSLALSSNGRVVAIGSFPVFGQEQGNVRIFSLVT